jgi:hypothetical protein
MGRAVAQLVEAANRKVAGSIPDGVIGPVIRPVDSASNRNEYQEYFLWGGVKAASALKFECLYFL